jgi:phosphoribosyl-AMP cyclohydrolase
MSATENCDWLNEINWRPDGLVPVIAQDSNSGRVLTMAWMNREALMQTIKSGTAVYWSRSRKRLWQKGERSGHTQLIQDVYLDCDKDTIVIKIIQMGDIACHTGRQSCFHYHFENGTWTINEPVIKEPAEIYKKD